jgi:hypothetical protein
MRRCLPTIAAGLILRRRAFLTADNGFPCISSFDPLLSISSAPCDTCPLYRPWCMSREVRRKMKYFQFGLCSLLLCRVPVPIVALSLVLHCYLLCPFAEAFSRRCPSSSVPCCNHAIAGALPRSSFTLRRALSTTMLKLPLLLVEHRSLRCPSRLCHSPTKSDAALISPLATPCVLRRHVVASPSSVSWTPVLCRNIDAKAGLGVPSQPC